jgi:hypothetical protein
VDQGGIVFVPEKVQLPMVDKINKRQGVSNQLARKAPMPSPSARSGSSYPLPFGKYKGTPVSALPDDYLQWLSTRELRDPLRSVVTRELQARGQQSALQEMSTRLAEANIQGFFIVQEGRESEVREYQEACKAAHKPSLCVALGKETATVAISYVGVAAFDSTLLQLQQKLERQWPSYAPQYLPPASIVLLGIPCALVTTLMPELIELLEKAESRSLESR